MAVTYKEYSLASVETGKVISHVYKDKTKIEEFRKKMLDSNCWNIVYREVHYSDWVEL